MLKLLTHPMLPPVLRGAILVDASHLPRYWVTVWRVTLLADLARSTQVKKLRYIETLYQHAEAMLGPGALDDALGALDDEKLSDILESWFVAIMNQATPIGADRSRWQTGLEFVGCVITRLSKSCIANEKLQHVEARLHRLSSLYCQLHIRRQANAEVIRSLPANVVQAFYQLLDPESITNPFKGQRTRWRAFIAFLLMLHQGLRRGEMLLLPADAIKSSFDGRQQRTRYWMNVQANPYEDEADDSRYSKPSIKNVHALRQIPVSQSMATIVQSYVENYRGRPEHSFLFNSQRNCPLSTETLTKIFVQVSVQLPSNVIKELEERTGKSSVTPHDLRHTGAVVRLNQLLQQGDSMDEALQKMRVFFGWSRTSDMPTRYARAVFEDRLAGVWNNIFDDRVSLLRSLPKGE